MSFGRTATAAEVVRGLDLSGRTMLVTGGGAGIGLATACALASAGARVHVADVDEAGSRAAIGRFREQAPEASIEFAALDLGSVAAVKAYAEDFSRRVGRLDVLIDNAGIMACPEGRTVDGHERQFGVNFLGHYVLTRALAPLLARAGRARVVTLSSIGHRRSDIEYDDIHFQRRPYDRWLAYGQSKTACALLAVAVDALWQDRGIRANAMNPGGSATGLHQYLGDDERRRLGLLDADDKVPERWRPPEQCAGTSAWLAASPDLEGVGGRYFEDFAEAPAWVPEDPMKGVRPYALSRENALRLWDLAAAMTGLPRGA